MNGRELVEAMSHVDEKYISEAEEAPHRRRHWQELAITAACLALVLVGSLLAGLPMKRMLGGARVCVLSLVRLLVMPAALWLVLRNLSIDPMVMGIAVTQMAMPTAINGTLLCMAYGGDSEAMAQITFMTTLASIVTIPLVAALLL